MKQTEISLVFRATLPIQDDPHEASSKPAADAVAHYVQASPGKSTPRTKPVGIDPKLNEVHRAMRSLHLLLRSERLYEKNHPRRLDSLDGAYDSLRNTADILGGLEIRIERGGLVVPRLSEAHLPDARGEMQALARDLLASGPVGYGYIEMGWAAGAIVGGLAAGSVAAAPMPPPSSRPASRARRRSATSRRR